MSRSASAAAAGPPRATCAGALGAGTMTLRVWRYGPGHEMAYHRHSDQEEVYQLVSGGPQEVFVEGEVVDGGGRRLAALPQGHGPAHPEPHATARPSGSRSAHRPAPGSRDGIRIDPETGEEIPRT